MVTPAVAPVQREVPRDVRRTETARLLTEAADASGVERDDLVNQVVVLNLGVARAIARRYRDRSVPLEDLEQVANVALVRAAQKFDIGQERDFLTYAVPTITGEIKRYFRDYGWTVRPPRRVQEIQSRVIEAHKQSTESGGRATVGEIALRLGMRESDVSEALQADGCFQPLSLDAPMTVEGSFSLGDSLESDDEGDRDALEARTMLQPLLRQLSERDRRILHLRFVEDRTQQEIGDELGVTQMQVSRLIRRILTDLRDEFDPAAAS